MILEDVDNGHASEGSRRRKALWYLQLTDVDACHY